MNESVMEKAKRELIRWLILQALEFARPTGASESLLYQVLADSSNGVTPLELRREIDYLEERELVRVERKPGSPTWHCELTRDGIDVVQYTVEVEPGIARPTKYW